MRKGEDPKYAHLNEDLHVLVEVFAPPGEAHSRMAHALGELKKYLIPVSVSIAALWLGLLVFSSLSLSFHI